MTSAEILRTALSAAEVNESFSEAVLRLRDDSRLCFCHRVGERWAKAVGPDHRENESGQRENESGVAGQLLAAIQMFRLNAKHLDINFADGSRWDEALQNLKLGNS